MQKSTQNDKFPSTIICLQMLIVQDEMAFLHICRKHIEELELNLQGTKNIEVGKVSA